MKSAVSCFTSSYFLFDSVDSAVFLSSSSTRPDLWALTSDLTFRRQFEETGLERSVFRLFDPTAGSTGIQQNHRTSEVLLFSCPELCLQMVLMVTRSRGTSNLSGLCLGRTVTKFWMDDPTGFDLKVISQHGALLEFQNKSSVC